MTVATIPDGLARASRIITNGATGGSAPEGPAILPSAKVYDAVDNLFDLSVEGRGLLSAADDFSGAELTEYLALTARLLEAGVVGFEDLEVDGRRYRSFVPFEIADPDGRRAKIYRDVSGERSRLNLHG
jgi:hypothetical protein